MGNPVTDNFPIIQEGILGSDFLRDATKINFVKRLIVWQNTVIPLSQRDTIIIPSRFRATMAIRVVNLTLAEGYIPCIDGIYLKDALVTNRDRRAFIEIINTSENDRELEIPRFEEIESISSYNPEFVSNDASKLRL